ncbi:uncharacterized protein FOMMEDRAFT_148062 [Fomitiporia mediterranea MF3/22]|uniref:uncharacterized protein n=1 Tax=Fomitiporia mediterranea (strain MF3/22) TaxID=694068 RepID=UPI0004408A11|nr:uncharacterized protein FOMMEDRAFT_148062 [Fomitiporia mediterranea MF3/22]EJD01611.1 hypothetical protein FOMMEDRAFT_148062 [Fomitiporia mediterranea MF3/22]
MPRNPNPTQYDSQMTKFKTHEARARRTSHASSPSHVADPGHGQIPRSRTPHPTRISTASAGAYSAIADQPQLPHTTSGGVSPHGWGESYGASNPSGGSHYPAYSPYNTMSSHDMSSTLMASGNAPQMAYTSSGQWILVFRLDGERQRQCTLPIEQHQVPHAQCPCGTTVRIVHLPSIVGWTPPFNVLWNFKKNTSNAWIEGTTPISNCISAAKCPSCGAQITLHASAAPA